MIKYINKLIVFGTIFFSIISIAHSITFNFKDADIRDVIEGFALMAGKSFIVDSRVTGKVTVISSNEMSVDEAEAMLYSILQVHGFVMQQQGEVVKIIPDQLMREGSIYAEDSSILPNDQIVTQLFKLTNMPVNEFANAVRPLMPKESSLVPFTQSNSIIITTNAFNINKIEKIIFQLDEPNLTETAIIKIRNLNALDVAKVLDRFFSDQKKEIGIKLNSPIFMVDKNTNSIIIKSHTSDISQINILINDIEESVYGSTLTNFLLAKEENYYAYTMYDSQVCETTGEKAYEGTLDFIDDLKNKRENKYNKGYKHERINKIFHKTRNIERVFLKSESYFFE